MGKITEDLLRVLEIEYIVLEKELSMQEIMRSFERAAQVLKEGKQFAFVLKRDFLQNNNSSDYKNNNSLVREDAIAAIIKMLDESDVVISTTGKIS